MVTLHFNDPSEFESLFKQKTKSVTDSIVQGIENAMQQNKRTALLFQITFAEYEQAYEISLPHSQWVFALENCLEHYHALELPDEQIDCWKLLEAAKAW